MDLDLFDCPNCNTSGILPTDHGLCPNCKKEIDLTKDKHHEADIEDEETAIEPQKTPEDEVFVECKNHQAVQATDKCSECWEAFCADCLIEIQGEQFCRSCNAMMIKEKITLPCKQASDALKFAIVGILIIGIILEPIAILKALKAKKMIRADRRLTGSNKATAALIIAVIYLLLITLLFVVLNYQFYAS